MKASARTVSFMDRIHDIALDANDLSPQYRDKILGYPHEYYQRVESDLIRSIQRDTRRWENLDQCQTPHFPHLDGGTVEIHAITPVKMTAPPANRVYMDEVWIFQVQTSEDWTNVRFMMRNTSDSVPGNWLTSKDHHSKKMLVMSEQWNFDGPVGDPEGESDTLIETVLDKAMRDLGIGSLDLRKMWWVTLSAADTGADSRFMEKQVGKFTSTTDFEGIQEAMSLFDE